MNISSYNISDVGYHYIGLRVLGGLPATARRVEQEGDRLPFRAEVCQRPGSPAYAAGAPGDFRGGRGKGLPGSW